MKVSKINPEDYPVSKRVSITTPIVVEVRGSDQVMTLFVNGKKVEAFKGMCIHLLNAQDEYEKAAF